MRAAPCLATRLRAARCGVWQLRTAAERRSASMFANRPEQEWRKARCGTLHERQSSPIVKRLPPGCDLPASGDSYIIGREDVAGLGVRCCITARSAQGKCP